MKRPSIRAATAAAGLLTGSGEEGSTGSGSSSMGRDDTALWEEATTMLRGELIRLGQEAARKMEVGVGMGD